MHPKTLKAIKALLQADIDKMVDAPTAPFTPADWALEGGYEYAKVFMRRLDAKIEEAEDDQK